MTKPTKKIENNTSKNLNISSKDKSIQVDNMERKFSKLTEMFTANEIKADMDLNEAAELLDEIDKGLAKGIENEGKRESVSLSSAPVRQSSFTSNRLYLTLGVSSFAAVVIAVLLISGGKMSDGSMDALAPTIAESNETANKNLIAPMYGFTESKGTSNEINMEREELRSLVDGLPTFGDVHQLNEKISSLAVGELLRFMGRGKISLFEPYEDLGKAVRTIHQIIKKENSYSRVELSLSADNESGLYELELSMGGCNKELLTDELTEQEHDQFSAHLKAWPELRTIIEREK